MRIIYIDLDALTPSHLGCYGYHRDTSPNIDRIASEGLRCTNVYVSDAPCLPSRTAFYSGRLGIQTGVVGHGGTAAEPKREGPDRPFNDRFSAESLARKLQRADHHTAMISPFGQRHGAHWFYAGFNEIHNTGGNGVEEAAKVQPILEQWIDDHAEQENWYLHVNYWDIHTPYRAPLDYGEPFANDPLPEWITDDVFASHRKKTGPHSAMEIGMYHGEENPRYPRHPGSLTDRKQLRRMIDGYDTAIRYVDDHIARLVDKLKAHGIYDETAIVISADHGENQGELGIYGEHGTADHITCNIPLIIKWPGGAKGKVDHGLHYHLDLAPTLMELLGGETPALWDGQSFAGTVRKGTRQSRDQLVVSQCCHVAQRSVRWDRWLYMRTYHCGFHLFPQEMLFDIEADPHELHDLAAEHPELCKEGMWRLAQWHDEQMWRMAQHASDVVDPLWQVIFEGGPHHARHRPGDSPLPKYIERLERTGRADGAAALREKYAAFLPEPEKDIAGAVQR